MFDEPPEEVIGRLTELPRITWIARLPNDLLEVEQVELRVREVVELAQDDEPGTFAAPYHGVVVVRVMAGSVWAR